jgi:hypothetical protein
MAILVSIDQKIIYNPILAKSKDTQNWHDCWPRQSVIVEVYIA